MGTRRNQLVTAIAVALLACATLIAPAPANAQDPPSPDESSALALADRLGALERERAALEASMGATQTELVDLAARSADRLTHYERAVHEHDAAAATLSRYSVSAYIGGNVVEAHLAEGVVGGTTLGLEPERRHVLAVTVRAELLDEIRRTLTALDEATQNLDTAEAAHRDAQSRLDDASRRHGAVAAEIESTRAAFDHARVAEAEAAERPRADAAARAADESRARRIDLLASTRRPESVHSGVVPPLSIRPELLATLGAEIPPTAADAYWRAAKLVNAARPDCEMDWALVAAIGKVETNHGTYGGTTIAPDGSTSPTILGIALDGSPGIMRINDTDGGALDGDPQFDRAVGPMQFIPSTWRSFATDSNGDGVADPHNVYDAAAAASTYLCSAARGPISVAENASRAVYAYNQSVQYNIEVLTLADHYRRVLDPDLAPAGPPPTVPSDPGDLPPPATPGTTTTTTTTTSSSTSTSTTTSTP